MGHQEIYTPVFFQFVQDHLQEDPALLLLKHNSNPEINIKEAVKQIAARQKAKSKLPSWVQNPQLIFPPTIPLEQCSSEETARFKSRLMKGRRLVDLTGGFGVDAFFLGENFEKVVYLERNEELVKTVRYNFKQFNPGEDKFEVLQGDALTWLEEFPLTFDWLYVDPARRGIQNQKLYRLKDCEPDVVAHWSLLKEKANNIMIKASPMTDIKEALRELPEVQQVIVLSVKNEVKELLFVWERKSKSKRHQVHTFDLGSEGEMAFSFTMEEEEMAGIAYALPGKYLIEPSSAVMKSGAFKYFAKHFKLNKLHPSTHLYSTNTLPRELPGKIFEVLEEVKLDKKHLKRHFVEGKVNVIVRNHPLKPEILKRKFGLRDGGEDFLISCKTMDGKARSYKCRRL